MRMRKGEKCPFVELWAQIGGVYFRLKNQTSDHITCSVDWWGDGRFFFSYNFVSPLRSGSSAIFHSAGGSGRNIEVIRAAVAVSWSSTKLHD